MGSRYSLRTLGSLGVDAIDDGGVRTPVLPSGKSAALLAYLALAPGRSVLRDELVDLLWAHVDVERARLAVRQALFQLRSAIGSHEILTEGRRVVLAGDIAMDLLDFRALAEDDRSEALELFSGSFLDGVSFPGGAAFEHWADRERARTDALLLRCAGRCVSDALATGRPEEATRLARRARDLLPGEQEAWRLVIETALATGDRALAVVEGELLEKWLGESEIDPSADVARVLRQLQRASAHAPVAAPEYESEFVGREGDLSELLKAYHSTVRGRPRHVHLTAPAGLGKSRLLAEFGARCRLMRGRVVAIAALPSDRGLPSALQARLVAALGTLPGAMAVSSASAAALVRLAPSLSNRFELRSSTSGVADDALTRSQVVRELVESVAAERTLVLVVDDLHWSDGESLASLQRLVEQLPANLLLVTSTRPPISLGGVAASSTRELAPLGEEFVRDLLVSLGLPAQEESSAPVVRAIADVAGGSPLNVLQLVRQGIENGWLRRVGEHLEGALDGVDLSQLDPIAGRLRDLPEADGRLLLALARSGAPLHESTLAAVVSAPIDDSLQRLAARGLVTATPSGWSCAHDVLAEQFLLRCTADDVRRCCAALGRAISRDRPSPSQERIAARFLAEGGDLDALRELVERELRAQRAAGRDISAAAMARELLGDAMTGDQLHALVAPLPIALRFRRRTARRATVAVAVAGALIALAAMRPSTTSLTVAQRPLGSSQSLVDSSLLQLRPELIVEQRDGRGRVVSNATDTIDVTLRDTISGQSRVTTLPLRDGRATFELLRGANLRTNVAVVRRRGARDSLLVKANWWGEVGVRLRFVSFKASGVEATPQRPTMRLPPGASVRGVLRMDYASRLLNETLVYAWTPTWGDAPKEARIFGMLSTPTDWRAREDSLSFVVPETPGEYFIAFLGGAETSEKFLLSGTNWVMKEARWGDGNDVAAWPRETLRRVTRERDVAVDSRILRMTDGRPVVHRDRHFPAAIRIVVDGNARTVTVE